jgi:biotin carboxyl carrier protein
VAAVTIDGAPDPRAVRVSVSATSRLEGDPTLVVAPGEADPPGSLARVRLGPVERRDSDGVEVREVVVDGWRIVVEVEPEARASLRERARRTRSESVAGGPVDVHAIIPGRIVAVNVAAGDAVNAGQQLLVLEAMKMQNELLAPREGTVDRVAVAVGQTVEVGDLLLVIR